MSFNKPLMDLDTFYQKTWGITWESRWDVITKADCDIDDVDEAAVDDDALDDVDNSDNPISNLPISLDFKLPSQWVYRVYLEISPFYAALGVMTEGNSNSLVVRDDFVWLKTYIESLVSSIGKKTHVVVGQAGTGVFKGYLSDVFPVS
ncbi:hypothetical protein H0H87_002722 [Tephrocybe sp. NHM501043]|nr:hypothetical protein H0H87_002722 [Tephrocybe sp. NHM501043]